MILKLGVNHDTENLNSLEFSGRITTSEGDNPTNDPGVGIL